MKRDRPNFSSATVFTAPVPADQRDVLPGGPFFTDSNQTDHTADVTDLAGRTLNGERTPVGKDRTEMMPPVTSGNTPAQDEAMFREFNTYVDRAPDVKNPEMLRSLSPPGHEDSPLAGLDRQSKKLNGMNNKIQNRSLWPTIFSISNGGPGSGPRPGQGKGKTKERIKFPIHKIGDLTDLSEEDRAEAEEASFQALRDQGLLDNENQPKKNRSVQPSIFVSNKKMPESLAKATAVRKGATALEDLKDPAPIGFTGAVHPLTQVAEHSTTAAVHNDTDKAHDKAADDHDKAAAKMAAFMTEAKPSKKGTGQNQIAGLSATREHHVRRAAHHRNRSAFLKHQNDRAEAEKAAKKKK